MTFINQIFSQPTKIPSGFEDIAKLMKSHNEIILEHLRKYRKIEDFPEVPQMKNLDGEAVALGYPIQGILKYHGMTDWENRIAYLPSISLNNGAAHTKTYVKFSSEFAKDKIIINERIAEGRELERALQTLDFIRKITGTDTKALVISKNYVSIPEAKGLGTSASASVALALASIQASLGDEYVKNKRFSSVVARYLAGSGCRSAAGGISLWLSYPGIPPIDSYAVRLNDDELENIALITIPVKSRIGLKTEEAHKDAPNSDFFKTWMLQRKDKVIDVIEAIKKSDWERIAQHAELDTIELHAVTMSGQKGKERKIIAWEPETIQIMRKVNELRTSGIPVYYSIDTGPTPVLITENKYVAEVCEGVEKIAGKNYIKSKIAGESHTLDMSIKEELLTEGVKKLINHEVLQ